MWRALPQSGNLLSHHAPRVQGCRQPSLFAHGALIRFTALHLLYIQTHVCFYFDPKRYDFQRVKSSNFLCFKDPQALSLN